jgi:hypothetical protein
VRQQFGEQSSLSKKSDAKGVTVHKLTEFVLGPHIAEEHVRKMKKV